MIRTRILGIPMHRQHNRRLFVLGYWLAILMTLTVLSRFPVPPDAQDWTAFAPLLVTLGIAGNLPLLLGGFSLGGAVSFYEGRSPEQLREWLARHRLRAQIYRMLWRFVPAERVRRIRSAYRPVDEREAQIRDQAYHRGFRLMMWLIYGSAVAYLLVSGADAALLPRFGLVLLELLLVASLSLPQSCILWSFPDVDSGDLTADPAEAQ